MFSNSRQVFYLFLISLVAFVISKLPVLGLPYYWDEMGVYSPASIYLAEHGLGLLPASLPPELSRGHPLLFAFIYGCFYKLFGISVYTGHMVSLSISLALLCSMYYIIGKVSNSFVALLSTVLLMVQPVFYAQSVLVLPEIMLALFCLWAVYACYRQNWLAFAIWASLALMIKESAIILPMLPVGYALVLWMGGHKFQQPLKVSTVLYIISPWLLFGLFLLVQKEQNGWYFFPLHIGLVKLDWDYVYTQNRLVQKFLFHAQARYWWVKVFLAGGIAWLLTKSMQPRRSFFLAALLFVLGFIAFSSVNFYMDRYQMAMLPILCWFVVLALYTIWKSKWFVGGVSLLLIGLTIPEIDRNEFAYDVNMGYVRMLDVQQRGMDYMCANVPTSARVAAFFPMNWLLDLTDNNGFKRPCRFTNVIRYLPSDPPLYIVQISGGYDFGFMEHEYELIHQEENGFAWVKVWKRKSAISPTSVPLK